MRLTLERFARDASRRLLPGAAAVLLCAFALEASAAIRIKTVEWNFGVNSGGEVLKTNAFTWPTRTVTLPESGVVVRSAWLEVEVLQSDANDLTSPQILFDAGAAATTPRFTAAGTWLTSSGEAQALALRADVTAAVAGAGNLGAGQTFTAAMIEGNARLNGHTAKLKITYEYDDTSARQVFTLKYPLYSVFASSIATFTTARAPGTHAMQYLARVSDGNPTLRQQWFEIHGYRQQRSGKGAQNTDGGVAVRVGAGADEPQMALDNGAGSSYGFRYLSNSDSVPGFALNTLQTANITTLNDDVTTLGGEVAVTVEVDAGSAKRTRTLETVLGQGSAAQALTNLSAPLFLEEGGAVPVRAWLRVFGSYDNALQRSLIVDSRIGASVVAVRSYPLRADAPRVSGYRFTHDVGAALGGWTSGAVVSSTFSAVTDNGAVGAVLVVTYEAVDEASHTNSYRTFGGTSGTGTSNAFATSFTTWFPELTGAKTLRRAYLVGDWHENTATADYATSADFAGSSSLSVNHRSQTEAHYVRHAYENTAALSTAGGSTALNMGINTAAGAFSGEVGVVYTVKAPPNAPLSLAQRALGGAALSTGTWHDGNTLVLAGALSAGAADALALEVEVKPLGTAFDATGLSAGTPVGFTATPVEAVVQVGPLTDGASYHWRARAVGAAGGPGAWSAFGGNAETERDFGVDVTSPTPPALASIVPVEGSSLNYRSFGLQFEDAADAASGVSVYRVEVATDPAFATLTFSSQPATSDAALAALGQNFNFWRARATDVAGNTGAWSATRRFRVDLTTPTVDDQQAGDAAWRAGDPGAVYDVNFADAGGSELGALRYKVHSAPGAGGVLLKAYTDITAAPAGGAAYTANWGVDFAALVESATNYVSVEALDQAGNRVELLDVFSVRKDTTPPGAPAPASPADAAVVAGSSATLTWSAAADLTSGVASYVLEIANDAGFASLAAASTQTALSSATVLLPDGDYFWRVVARDAAGNASTPSAARSIRFDTAAPTFTDNQAGDATWRASDPGAVYDVDFADAGAGLDSIAYTVRSLPGGGGVVLKAYTPIAAAPLNLAAYTADWGLDFAALQEGVSNYVSVRAVDLAGATATLSDVFFVYKDTTPPVVTDNQAGDAVWRSVDPGAVYDVDFSDLGGSLLARFQTRITTAPAGGGTLVQDWTDVASGIGAVSYSANWGLPFASLVDGAQWVSVRAVDVAGSTTTALDVFFVRRDAQAPAIVDNQTGDDTVRASNDGVYDVDFSDGGGSGLERFQVRASTSAGGSGTFQTAWTDVVTGIGADAYAANWSLPQAVFDAMGTGQTNYVSVRVFDVAGSSSAVTDAFYVVRQGSNLSITNNQPFGSDGVWRRTNTGSYDVDFANSGVNLDRFEVRTSTVAGGAGPFTVDWTQVAGSIGATSYTADWSLPAAVFDGMLSHATNYVSVRVFDTGAAELALTDAFFVVKDTHAPVLVNAESGGDLVWRNADPGAVYDVDFDDAGGSGALGFQVQAATNAGNVPPYLFTYDTVADGTPAASLSADWALPAGRFAALLQNATNWISLRYWDLAGNTVTVNDAFFIRKDQTLPTVSDNAADDAAWSDAPGTTRNVDFADGGGSGLTRFQARALSDTAGFGVTFVDWTDVVTGLSDASYTTDWSLPPAFYDLLPSATAYVSVRAYDAAGNVSNVAADVFKVLKDTAPPVVVDNEAGGENAWRKAGRAYDVDFHDAGSTLKDLEYSVSLTPGAGDAAVVAWTPIVSALGQLAYTADWTPAFGGLAGGATNYVSVRATDVAGKTTTYIDAFRVLKDTEAPQIVDNHVNQGVWRSTNSMLYDLDFSDAGNSRLRGFEVRATTGPAGSGQMRFDWTAVQSGIDAAAYTADWGLSDSLFAALRDGATNWVSVRVFDHAGSTTTLVDAFRVFKDTTPPQVVDNQAGDVVWRRSDPGAVYDVDFLDPGSGVERAQYKATTAAAQGGSLLVDWTDIFVGTGVAVYSAAWGVDFAALVDGAAWISVRALDRAGSTTTLEDAFFVRKDTTPPAFADNQAGDEVWRMADPGAVYDVDFADFGVGLASAAYRVFPQAAQGGVEISTAQTLFELAAPAGARADDFALVFTLLQSGTNYVSLTAWDALGSSATLVDAFYVRKDTVAPAAIGDLAAATPQLPADEGALAVTWTAPGDDVLSGAATGYLVRVSTAANFGGQGDFDAAAVALSTLVPVAAGGAQGLRIAGLTPAATYWVAVEAVDKAGNQAALSNTTGNSAYAGVDKTTPAAVGDLAASEGAFEGQIDLTWTAPGEGAFGDVNVGTAAAYDVRYATFLITAANYDLVSAFSQSWVPLAPGAAESRTLSGLSAGTSYYIALKAVDETGSRGAISNVEFRLAAPPGARDGLIVYGETVSGPRYRQFTPPVWGGELGLPFSADVRWARLRSAPALVNNAAAAFLDASNQVRVFEAEGTPVWTEITPAPTPNPGSFATRAFDIAYEQNTGRLLLVYYDGTAGSVEFGVWSTTAAVWAYAPQPLAMTGLTGAIRWVRLEARPASDEIVLAVLDANNDMAAAHWTGSAWNANSALTTAASAVASEPFDVAWEAASGSAMILWGEGTATRYSRWNGATFASAQNGPAIAGSVAWLRLAADPASNRLAMTTLDSGDDWNAAVWNHNASGTWGPLPAEDTRIGASATRVVDVAWTAASGQAVVVAADFAQGGNDDQVSYITWSGGAWNQTPSAKLTDANTVWGAGLNLLALYPDPDVNKITLLGIASNNEMRTIVWDGAAWSNSGASDNLLHTADLTSAAAEPAAVAFSRNDAVPPNLTDNQGGDSAWRNSSGTLYNIDATDSGGSRLARLQTRILTPGDVVLQDWTDQVTGINANAYSADWALGAASFALLQEGQNDVSVRALDGVGNASPVLTDAFFILKDTTPPAAPALAAVTPAEGALLNAGDVALDFESVADAVSGTLDYEVEVATDAGFPSLTVSTRPTLSQVALLNLGTTFYYWRVRTRDVGGNTGGWSPTRTFRVDRQTPTVVDNQAGDTLWRAADPGAVYDVDFQDAGGSQLDQIQYKVHSAPAQGGVLLKAFTDISAPPVGPGPYTAAWGVDFAALVESATNYVTVRAADGAGNAVTLADVFYVLKDTTPPGAPALSAPADLANLAVSTVALSWSAAFDAASGILEYEVQVSTSEDFAATADTATLVGLSTQTAALADGTYWWRVRARDRAAWTSVYSATRAFTVAGSAPNVSDNQIGDFTWRRAAGTLYDVDFAAPASSLDQLQYTVYSAPARGGVEVVPYTDIQAAPVGGGAYTTDWPVAFAALLEGTSNWVSVRVTNASALESAADDVFFVLKDTTPPSITDNQADDPVWRRVAPGAIYDVDFADTGGSRLVTLQSRLYTGPGETGNQVIDWTDIAGGLDADQYTAAWAVGFSTQVEGRNYVSVRAVDHAGSTTTLVDAFFVQKDTTPPSVIDNHGDPDPAEATDNTALYDIDFADAPGASGLDHFEVRASITAGGAGGFQTGWTDVAAGIGAQSYAVDWDLPQAVFDAMATGATNYVSARVFDVAGASTTVLDLFRVVRASTTLGIVNNEPFGSDPAWRAANDGVYDVDFAISAGVLSDFQVRSSTNPGNAAPFSSDWTNVQTALGTTFYATQWSLPQSVFDAMLSNVTNYVSVRVLSTAPASLALADAFFVLKDTVPPSAVTNLGGGDLTWRSSDPGAVYDVDFADAGSRLQRFELSVWTGTGETGTPLVPATTVQSGLGAAAFTADWALPAGAFDAMLEGVTNYVSVRAFDLAGNSTSVVDAFFVRKDTRAPAGVNNEPAGSDPVWRRAAGTARDVDFSDLGGSRLQRIEALGMQGQGLSGQTFAPWTAVVSGLDADAYAADFPLSGAFFSLLREGTNYVSLRGVDNAGNVSNQLVDAFKVLKDTTAPTFVDNQADAGAWSALSPAFDVDVFDAASTVDTLQFSASLAQGSGDASAVPWTTVFAGVSSAAYTADWQLAFAALQGGATNYVSLRAWDAAGSTATLVDAFRVLKDTVAPQLQDNHADDGVWRSTNALAYDVDFSDAGNSGLERAQVRARSAAGGAGTLILDWTDVVSGLNGAAAYSADWQVPNAVFDALRDEATNFISVRAFDRAGSSGAVVDALRVFKDTTPARVFDFQAGDDAWRALDPGAVYDVEFEDPGSLLASAEYRATQFAGGAGLVYKDWTAIFTSTGHPEYRATWGLDFAALDEGQAFVSVRASDRAGNTTTTLDVFHVRKDTSAPVVGDNQPDAQQWLNADPGAVFDVDFTDAGIGLSSAVYVVYDQPGRTGTQAGGAQVIFNQGGAFLTTRPDDWAVDFALLAPGTNYVSVTAFDGLATSATVVDAFTVWKDTVAPGAIADLAAATPQRADEEGALDLTWSAPGDDVLQGAATGYLVRLRTGSNFAGQTDFELAAVAVSTLVPKSGGALEGLRLSGLNAGVTYYVAIEAVDKAGNQAALSNLAGNSAFAAVDKTTPSAVADLAAAEGGFQGQIDLTWSAPGEGIAGNVALGTATAYEVRYATFSIDAANFDSPDVTAFAQTWVPGAPGAAQAQTLLGLNPGTTYFIALRALDETGAAGAVSNAASSRAAPQGASDGDILYGTLANDQARHRFFTAPSWSGEFTAPQTGAEIRWIRLQAANVIADRRAAGLLSSDNALRLIEADAQGAWTDITPAPAPAPGASAARAFDLAYEQTTGRLMFAYYDGTPGSVTFAVWSTTASVWSQAPSALNLAGVAGAVQWVRLEPRPAADEIVLAAADAAGALGAAHWNGASWDVNTALTAALSATASEAFDVAWEGTSGRAMVLWGEAAATQYAVWTGASFAAPAAGPNVAAGVTWVALAGDPTSDRIGLSTLDDAADWNAAVWNHAGSAAWGALAAEDASVSPGTGRHTDLAWERSSGDLLVVAVDRTGSNANTRVDWAVWQSGAWSVTPSAAVENANTTWGGAVERVELVPDPNTDSITLLGHDVNGDLRSTVWSGVAWAGAGTAANAVHTTALSDPAYAPAAVVFDRHDAVPPTLIDNQAGDPVWRGSSGTLYNVDAADTGGSKLTSIETRVHTQPALGGTLVEDWTAQVAGINADSYGADWALSPATFDKLPQGQSWVSVRVRDGVGSTTQLNDAFFVRKDTAAPSVVNGESALQPVWRSSARAGGYDVDFLDTAGASTLETAEYAAHTGPGQSGQLAVPFTPVFAGLGNDAFTTDWGPDFALLAAGTNYISVRVWDFAGSTVTLVDAFRVLKDTQAPAAIGDLAAAPGATRGNVEITWTAPGDDGAANSNAAGGYMIRYATQPITGALFDSATDFAQSLVPKAPGQQESLLITGLEAGATYYFAVRTRDKVPNTAPISNVPNAVARADSVFLNEVYAAGAGAAADWVELHNNTPAAFPLDGWTVEYNQGPIAAPGAQSTVWTGGPADSVAAGGYFLLQPGSDLERTQSYHVLLVDSSGTVVDRAQWPAHAAGFSVARINDGNADFLELDPTPTPAGANNISTGPVRISEVRYAAVGDEFIELANVSGATVTLTGYTLRSKNGVLFGAQRTVPAGGFNGFDANSVDASNVSYTDAFGAAGLDAAADFVALENPAGQIVDRVSWETAATLYRGPNAALKAFTAPAPAAVAGSGSIGRGPDPGSDTGNNASDFAIFSAGTPGGRNQNAAPAPSNSLAFPGASARLARATKLDLTLGQPSAASPRDLLWARRTAGTADPESPHVFYLPDLGVDLESTARQAATVTFEGAADLDGNTLVDGAVYEFILQTDPSAASRAPQIVVGGLTYDAALSTAAAFDAALPLVDEGANTALLRLRPAASGGGAASGLEVEAVRVQLTDSGGAPLTTAQARALVAELSIVLDAPEPDTTGMFHVGIDTGVLGTLPNAAITLDGSGFVTIPVGDPDGADAFVASGAERDYFVVARWALGAGTQTVNTVRATLDPDTGLSLRDRPSDVVQPLSAQAAAQSAAGTLHAPKGPPAATTWPRDLGGRAEAVPGGSIVNDAGDTTFVGTKSGRLVALNNDGSVKWSFQPTPAKAIDGAPTVVDEGGTEYIYFVNTDGDMVKVRDAGTQGVQEWKFDLQTGDFQTTPSRATTTDYVYLAAGDGRVYKLDAADGTTAPGWSFDLAVAGVLHGTMVTDDYTTAVNHLWIGSQGGSFYRLSLQDGTVTTSFESGAPMRTSAVLDSGLDFGGQSNNIYFGADDGKLYGRVSSNLTSVPAGWTDFQAGGRIRSSPFMSFYEPYGSGYAIYFGSDDGKLYKIRSDTGAKVWEYDAGSAITTIPVAVPGFFVGAADSYVYFGTEAGQIFALTWSAGALRPGFPVTTGAPLSADPVVDAGTKSITFPGNDGKVYRIDIQ